MEFPLNVQEFISNIERERNECLSKTGIEMVQSWLSLCNEAYEQGRTDTLKELTRKGYII